MSKYEPLQSFLTSQPKSPLRLKIKEVEDILGFRLPASARLYAAWWSNAPGSHVQAQSWLAAGFETTEVDVNREQKVTFTPAPRTSYTNVVQEARPTATPSSHHPAYGALKGMITLLPDVDYTEPADPEWGKVYED